MGIQQLNLTITNSAAAISGLPLGGRKYFIFHNPSATYSIAFTFDGSTPVVNGNGITLFPGGTFTSDQYDTAGTITAISSGASQAATILVA